MRHNLSEAYGKLSMQSASVSFEAAHYEVLGNAHYYPKCNLTSEQPDYAEAMEGARDLSSLIIGCLWTHFPQVGHSLSYIRPPIVMQNDQIF